MRRQKREEMRLEAERLAYRQSEEDEEEAARERRRRARQERMRSKETEDAGNPGESVEINSHSVTVSETASSSVMSSGRAGEGDDEEQALLDRLAKREERRQRRMKEALDRQIQNESEIPTYSTYSTEEVSTTSTRQPYYERSELLTLNSKQQEKEEEEVAPQEEEDEQKEDVVEEKPRRFNLQVKEEDEERKSKQQNGGLYEDGKYKKVERTLSRGSMRSSEAAVVEDADVEEARLEAERKLEELKRRRDETENEEFERMKQKQQEAEAELEELKRKREERRKVLEEEERQKKQEDAERKAREEEEKRRMKEEIEKRRAEAAERRQKFGDEVDDDSSKPFKCVSPRGSSLKIGERAEFLNKSAQKSAVKTSHSPVVSKIDNRLEQYTTAVQTNKDVRSPRPTAIDLPTAPDGVRNIKSMWEKGSVYSSSASTPSTNKDAAGIKVGVAGRINDWLNKTPEAGKTSGGRPVDLKPGDVTGKRNLWENKSSTATKVAIKGEGKSVANGMGH